MQHERAIDCNPAAWCAVELALLDAIGASENASVEQLLGLRDVAGRFRYTAVLGDAAPERFALQLRRYLQAGFSEFKIKLSGDRGRDLAKVRALREAGIAPACVRADANNLWPDAAPAIAHLQALDYAFRGVEEPLRPGDYEGMRRVAHALGAPVILDESLTRVAQLDELREGSCWMANVRVSKMGGLQRSLAVARAARSRGIPVIVGAHVGETSVLTRAALTVATAVGDGLAAQEGAFGTHLLVSDAVAPVLMFGARGVLDVDALPPLRPGLGLTRHIDEEA